MARQTEPDWAAIGSNSAKSGTATEKAVALALKHRGCQMIEKVETGWKILRGPGGRILRAFSTAKVAGDFRAVIGDGRSVLVESKLRAGVRLTWTDFQTHQHASLNEHSLLGGLSLVAWTCDNGLVIVEYDKLLMAGFKPKHGLSWDEVNRVALGYDHE